MARNWQARPQCEFSIFTSQGYIQCKNGSLLETTNGKHLCKVHADKVVRQKWNLLQEEDERELGLNNTIRNDYCKAKEVDINKLIERIKKC